MTNDPKPSTDAWEFSLGVHRLGQVHPPNKKATCAIYTYTSMQV